MSELEVFAWAKINLSLDILGPMPGGYHRMKMVMQSTGLRDRLRIRLNSTGEFSARSNFGFLPTDSRNDALRAARLFLERIGRPELGVELELEKHIPVGAGLGGGSADAAAVLRGLNELCRAGLGRAELEKLGGELGSDVPFCVAGGTQLAGGRGDELTELPPLPDCGIVICKPGFSIRTPYLFSRVDGRRSRLHPDTAGMVEAIGGGDLAGVARRCHNVFEDVLPRNCGEVRTIKSRLLDLGALGAVMSGTGSAVFGIFEDMDAAGAAAAELGREYRDCFAVPPVPKHL